MARNESHWGLREKATQIHGVHEVDDKVVQDAKYEALPKQVSLLMSERSEWVSAVTKQVMNCATCGEGHNTTQCPIAIPDAPTIKQVDYINQGQKFQGGPYSGTYF